ncbi:hypothetical protein [Nostoc sp. C052]|uniref:hypothetical protein n=1 Tax=Nostoc sp. C052 TaxID=2576902 RepID=UPI0015C40DD5|nr:hypothetical protein [Nostoc sp. C052]
MGTGEANAIGARKQHHQFYQAMAAKLMPRRRRMLAESEKQARMHANICSWCINS